jgi:hypothetical protein
VSAENVQATIEIPNSHQGIPRPPRKNSEELLPAVFEATQPIDSTITKNIPTIIQSIVPNAICILFYDENSGVRYKNQANVKKKFVP